MARRKHPKARAIGKGLARLIVAPFRFLAWGSRSISATKYYRRARRKKGRRE